MIVVSETWFSTCRCFQPEKKQEERYEQEINEVKKHFKRQTRSDRTEPKNNFDYLNDTCFANKVKLHGAFHVIGKKKGGS